jgi:hypothetical protein
MQSSIWKGWCSVYPFVEESESEAQEPEIRSARFFTRIDFIGYCSAMSEEVSGLSDWTPEQVAQGKQWVQAWESAGAEMERLRRKELRSLDVARAISLLCGPADYRVEPRAPKPTSGLIEQQRWFMKFRRS